MQQPDASGAPYKVAFQVSDADPLGKIGYVAAGVAELIKRQAEGYAYMRA